MLVLFGDILMIRRGEIYVMIRRGEIYVSCLTRRFLSDLHIRSSFYRLFFLQSMNPIIVL